MAAAYHGARMIPGKEPAASVPFRHLAYNRLGVTFIRRILPPRAGAAVSAPPIGMLSWPVVPG